MARKVFQIAFILLILIAFGTVFNHYLKHKISDPDDYLSYIEHFPKQRISRIDPIVIGFAQNFNKADFPLNIPIKDKIVRIDPAVKGTLYWSDTKTLEFYPDEPLQSNSTYFITVDLNKVFKSNDKIKDFRFQLNTFKQQIFVEISGFTPTDTTLTKQKLTGNILFNDYIDLDEVNTVFTAKQKDKNLQFTIKPGMSKNNFVFTVENIVRSEKQDTLIISWKLKKMNLKGKEHVVIPGLNTFSIKETSFIDDTLPRLVIQFSDPILKNASVFQNIHIHGATADSFNIYQNSIIAYFNDSCPDKIYLHISEQLKNTRSINLSEPLSRFLTLEKDEPGLTLNDSNFIIAEQPENFHWLFKAKKLRGVDIQIIKIYQSNILQFLQSNTIQEINQLDRVGTVVYEHSVDLSDYLQYNPLKWTTYSLNINDFIPEQGCIYSILLSYRDIQKADNKVKVNERTNWESFYPELIQNEKRHHGIHQNLYYTTLSVFSKITQNDSLYIWINDIVSGLPQKEVKIEVLNYQFQPIARSKTNTQGIARIKLTEDPFFISAQVNDNKTFLKIPISSNKIPNKIPNGFFFQQNRIWQGNDTLQLAFVYNNIFNQALPPSLSFSITDHYKKKLLTRIVPYQKHGLYIFKYIIPNNLTPDTYFIETNIDKQSFSTEFHVVKADFYQDKCSVELMNNTVNSVTYAINSVLKTNPFDTSQMEILLTTSYNQLTNNSLPQVTLGTFLNPPETTDTFAFNPNINGTMLITVNKNRNYHNYKVHHSFTIKNSDQINNISHQFNFNVLPSKQLITINKENQAAQQVYPKFRITKNGISTPITLSLFIISNQNDSILLEKKTISPDLDWFYYYPTVKLQSGLKYAIKAESGLEQCLFTFNCCSDNPNILQSDAIPDFKVLIDSEPINNGDSLIFSIQSKHTHQILLVLENHNGIHFQRMQTIASGQTKISIKADNSWMPTVLLSVYAINYGKYSTPIRHEFKIKQSNALLEPVIFAPQEAEAETKMFLSIKELSQKSFSYIVAVSPVISEFKTKIFSDFLVNCYHFYGFETSIQHTLGYYGNPVIDNLEANYLTPSSSLFNRFEYYLGPFTLNEKEVNNHEIELPQFIGDIEIKVIAYNQTLNKYAETKHQVSVHKPLMIITKTPQSIAPDEQISFPVKVYSSRNEKRMAQITLNNVNDLNIIDSISKNILINQLMTEPSYFNLSAKHRNGLGQFDVSVNDSAYWAEKKINIPIKSNSKTVYKSENKKLALDEKWQTRFTPVGIKGTNKACIESSVYGQFHINQIIQKLLQNPHDDLEHLISSAYPLLFIKDITQLTPETDQQVNSIINYTINQLIYYQSVNGGFTIWPTDTEINPWLSVYAGYFMLEAQNKGFNINQAVFNKWLRYQRRACLIWSPSDKTTDLTQCFGLYTLSIAGQPDLNSMNKLIDKKIYSTSRFLLAMAYYLSDESKIGQQLLLSPPEYSNKYSRVTYGDCLRDMAIWSDAYRMYNEQTKSDSIFNQMIKGFDNSMELNSQGVAFAIASLGKYIKPLHIPYQKINYTTNKSTNKEIESNKAIAIVDIPIEFTLSQTIDIKNKSNAPLYMSIDYNGKPETATNKNTDNEIDASFELLNTQGDNLLASNLNLNDKLFAKITIHNNNKLKNEPCFVEFPLANCFELDGNPFIKGAEINNLKISNNELFIYFTQNMLFAEILIPLKCIFKGQFKQAPLLVRILYDPNFQRIINGLNYQIK